MHFNGSLNGIFLLRSPLYMLFIEDFNCVYFLSWWIVPVHSAESLTADCHASPGLHEGATVRQDSAGFLRLVT